MENPTGAYALYEFLKELVENGTLKDKNDNSDIYFQDEAGVMHPITDFYFDDDDDNAELVLWE